MVHGFDDARVDSVAVHFVGDADGVEDGGAVGAAVGDDGDAVDAEQGAASGLVRIEAYRLLKEDLS